MSDAELRPEVPTLSAGGQVAAPGLPLSSPTAGQLLQTARRAAGLSIEELSTRVKVSVQRLAALEEDRLGDWPDANLTRAVAASVCRQVRLDPAIVLARLPKAEQPVWLGSASDTPVGFRERGGFTLRGPAARSRFSVVGLAWALVCAALVCLLVLALYFAPELKANLPWLGSLPLAGASASASAAPEPVLPPDAGPTDTRLGTTLAQESPALKDSQSPTTATTPTTPTTPGAAAAPRAGASSLAGPMVAGAVVGAVVGSGAKPVLVFKARGWTWIGVTDAHGVSILNKTLAAGESATASGALPLWVVVGRADQTDVEVRGNPLPLQPSAPDKVAKFKVE